MDNAKIQIMGSPIALQV